MSDLALLNAFELAALLEPAIQRLGQLGQSGINALVERLASAPDCPDSNAGVVLIDRWIGDPEA